MEEGMGTPSGVLGLQSCAPWDGMTVKRLPAISATIGAEQGKADRVRKKVSTSNALSKEQFLQAMNSSR